MFGLVDCNNFFVSCERVFNPSLNGKPVVVLSNNDGCIISRSQEAKDLGIPMGEPVYKIRELIKSGRVHVFSSNYALYGDMSARVMNVLASLAPEIEVYSIDEAFLHLEGIPDLVEYGKKTVRTVTKNTGIPVSLGMASTKTLAKLAGHFAKKYPGYEHSCLIDTDEKRIKALQLTPVGEVWGIGRKHKKMLEYHSVNTAFDLTQKPRSWIRKNMTVVGERTWQELQGIPSISDEHDEEKKQICTSRSFGEPVREFTVLMEAIANFAASCSRKLREQKSYARMIMIFISTGGYRTEQTQHYQTRLVNLSFPTNDTSEIISCCRQALGKIYRDGCIYKRAGVTVSGLVPETALEMDLFDPLDREKQRRLSKALDEITKKNGTEIIKVAAQGGAHAWASKKEFVSRCFTTNPDDIITVKC
jgi:DNA polymerase V